MVKNKTSTQDVSFEPEVTEGQSQQNASSNVDKKDDVEQSADLADGDNTQKDLQNKTKPSSTQSQPAASKKLPSKSVDSEVKFWDLSEAVAEVKKHIKAKFVESFDVVFKLGIDPKQGTQQVRGFTLLDHDYPRPIRIAVLTEDEAELAAVKKAGADRVGYYDLIEDIQAGKLDFDALVTAPGNVFMLAKLGKILGTKGLMPNPKLGTVTTDLAQAVLNIKNRQVNFRSDRYGLIHASVGKVNFADEILADNVNNLARTLVKNRPADAKGVFLRKLWCSSTMGNGLQINVASLKLS